MSQRDPPMESPIPTAMLCIAPLSHEPLANKAASNVLSSRHGQDSSPSVPSLYSSLSSSSCATCVKPRVMRKTSPSSSSALHAPGCTTPLQQEKTMRKYPKLVAPCPRRVVSPELIFRSSALKSLSRRKLERGCPQPKFNSFSFFAQGNQKADEEQQQEDKDKSEECEQQPQETLLNSLPVFDSTRYFRPIVDRPDVELTSPPLRATNPVIFDSRFHAVDHFDLDLDLLPTSFS